MEKVGQGNVFGNNLYGKQAFQTMKSRCLNGRKFRIHDLAHKLKVF